MLLARREGASAAKLVRRRRPRRPGAGGGGAAVFEQRWTALVASVLLGVAIVVAAVLVASDLTPGPGARMKVIAMLGAAGWFAAGFLARRRQSTRRLWLLMLAAGCAWLLGALR